MTADIIRIYGNDSEIIDKLILLPPIPVEPFKGLTILQHLERNCIGVDFGMVFPFQNVFYVIYKYGSQTDSGLFLVEADFEHAKSLLRYFELADRSVFPNDDIYNRMKQSLLLLFSHFQLL